MRGFTGGFTLLLAAGVLIYLVVKADALCTGAAKVEASWNLAGTGGPNA